VYNELISRNVPALNYRSAVQNAPVLSNVDAFIVLGGYTRLLNDCHRSQSLTCRYTHIVYAVFIVQIAIQ